MWHWTHCCPLVVVQLENLSEILISSGSRWMWDTVAVIRTIIISVWSDLVIKNKITQTIRECFINHLDPTEQLSRCGCVVVFDTSVLTISHFFQCPVETSPSIQLVQPVKVGGIIIFNKYSSWNVEGDSSWRAHSRGGCWLSWCWWWGESGPSVQLVWRKQEAQLQPSGWTEARQGRRRRSAQLQAETFLRGSQTFLQTQQPQVGSI